MTPAGTIHADMTRDVLPEGAARWLLMWQCSGCGDVWLEDELQQVQPDGHDACPNGEHETDGADPELVEVHVVVFAPQIADPPAPKSGRSVPLTEESPD